MDRPLLIHRQGSHENVTCVVEAGSVSRSKGISIRLCRFSMLIILSVAKDATIK
jgi:hypothetical protein